MPISRFLASGVLLASLCVGLTSCCCPPQDAEPMEVAERAPVEEAAASRPEPEPIYVKVTTDGRFTARGPDHLGPVLAEGDLAGGSQAETQAAIDHLRLALTEIAAGPGLREADGSSRLRVIVEGERATKWHHIQWIMQACADPAVRIDKLQFRTRKTAD